MVLVLVGVVEVAVVVMILVQVLARPLSRAGVTRGKAWWASSCVCVLTLKTTH